MSEQTTKMVISAVSDLHGHLPDIKRCDLLLIAGDILPLDVQSDAARSLAWLRGEFATWLDRIPAEHVIGIAGNHDFLMERRELIPDDLRWTYLQDEETTVAGLRVYGTPWTPTYGLWAFEAMPAELQSIYDRIPEGIDIVLSHGPPYGQGDRAPRLRSAPDAGGPWEHVGSPELLAAILRIRPRLVIYGHIHEDGGWNRRLTGQTTLMNVSILDGAYNVARAPAVFELGPPGWP